MSDWCKNNLTIEHDDPNKVMEFVHAYKKSRVCEHYCSGPMDKNGNITVDPNPNYWYDWCIKNWGIKWDIGSDNDQCRGLHPTIVGNQATMSFDSLWTPPVFLYKTLCKLGFSVEATYFEPRAGFCGIFDDGEEEYIEYRDDKDMIPNRIWDEYNLDEFFEDEENND